MRKSLIITVVIALLCLCGCEAVVTVPESPEPTKASEMLLTTTAAEESTDKLEATTTSSVEIDVPGKNEMVKGIYDIPEGSGTIKIKITDLLSESLEVEVR